MAVDIRIDGKVKYNTIAYSVVEDGTPVDPSDMTGGVGQFSIDLDREISSKSYNKKFVDIEDSAHGTSQGYVSAISGSSYGMTLTVDSRLVATIVTRTAQPYNGSLDGAIRYYLGLVGLTDRIVVSLNIANIQVNANGWTDNVWDQLKRLCSAKGVEIALISDNIVVRGVRERIGVVYRNDEASWSVDSANVAQSVEIMYYNAESKNLGPVYPVGGALNGVQVFQVDANEVLVVELPLGPASGTTGMGSSVISVQQPTMVNYVTPEHDTSSVYSVVDSEGEPVDAAQWVRGGGSVSVVVLPDTETIEVTIVGASGLANAPYRLSSKTPGNTDTYPALRIVGTGTFYDKRLLTLYTGHTVDVAPTIVGVRVDNPFINDISDALRIGSWTLAKYTGPEQKASVTSMGINRYGQTDSYRYPTIAEFNAEYAGKSFAMFNAQWAGKTIADFNAAQFLKVSEDFDNQAFGNIAGARIYMDNAWYRIRSGTTTAESISYDMEMDTTVRDFNSQYAGMTFGQFNARFAGQTIADYNYTPMRVE